MSQPLQQPFTLSSVGTKQLLEELAKRSGPVKYLAKAGLIQLKKSEDYNNGQNSIESYFPFGLVSYSQMIHTKSQRLISLAVAEKQNNPNFESVTDTALDLINYSTFLARYSDTSVTSDKSESPAEEILLTEDSEPKIQKSKLSDLLERQKQIPNPYRIIPDDIHKMEQPTIMYSDSPDAQGSTKG
jgi:hypothetical protein